MMKIPRRRILGLMAGALFSAMAAGGPAPAGAQGFNLVAPTHPTVARWLGLKTGRELFLNRSHQEVRIADFAEPRRVRLCVTPHPNHVAALMITENGETVVPVGHCREVDAARITVTPARDMGGRERVTGLYGIVG